jgi:hypothetical protein
LSFCHNLQHGFKAHDRDAWMYPGWLNLHVSRVMHTARSANRTAAKNVADELGNERRLVLHTSSWPGSPAEYSADLVRLAVCSASRSPALPMRR